jgi:WD40 repeat protein
MMICYDVEEDALTVFIHSASTSSHISRFTFHIFSTVLASRGDDGSVRVWDIAGQLSQSTKMQTPLKCIPDLMNLYPSANVAFR